ncbi:SURVIVAL MOTOR NEURON-LIKE PROTEIN 1 [Salix purpurea]|uniref:SURVIVAL MOTOR NEURON-LIKE PROTEIN 1 n=1 Tax=Salix purpurea TaxID=77065 RepID=A0A9Q0TIE2_SALPP|nr:SURVIVAL MOTOR NEURON-LIKE PROTEIN 1 [Salix purpurea]
MGKEGELWDDSALINAFDDAIFKYKKMHGKKRIPDKSSDGGKFGGGTDDENASAVTGADESLDGTVKVADESSNVTSNTVTELGETKNLAPAKLKNCVDSLGPDPYVDPSNGGAHAQTLNGCLYSHGTEDYNQLLNQYYELEEKRQMILQQLNVYYQYPVDDSGSGGYWGTCSASQDPLVAATQASLTPLICSCCPYACHCSVAPCSSFSSCTLGGTSLGKACADSSPMMNPGKSFPPIDDDIVKTAMDAAERAMSSMTMNAPAVKSDTEGNKAEKSEDNGGEITQNTSSETDLTVVLNAWYSAGFYTGKYLTERSIAKK